MALNELHRDHMGNNKTLTSNLVRFLFPVHYSLRFISKEDSYSLPCFVKTNRKIKGRDWGELDVLFCTVRVLRQGTS